MPADIRGGISRQHRLGNQAEIEAAEAALQARSVQGQRRPLPPPAPLPPEMLDDPVDMAQVQGPGPAALPTDEAPDPVAGSFLVQFSEAGVYVTLQHNGRTFVGEGSSITEALGIAAGEFEEGLAQPVCPHCGQIMPTED